MTKWAIAPLRSSEPVTWFKPNDSREGTIAYCQMMNASHRVGRTGKVFKVVKAKD